ncbi:MAG: hypothetical protein CBC01_02280 [Betaproteobacteria bacterium TMED41]|nr:MAG: hypothetical protein CBC01_02280 [Betaproteobacteria bacterium TMED41]
MFNKMIVLGCGLIGCSIAGAAKQKKIAKQIIGIETQNINYVKKLSFFDEIKNSILEVDNADLVLICTPIASLSQIFGDLIYQHSSRKYGLVTDVFSTKKSLLNLIFKLSTPEKISFYESFLSSHPLAGSEKIGAVAANVKLFENSKILICPFDYGNEFGEVRKKELIKQEQKKILVLESFWSSLGGIPKILPISQHDLLFAGVSHFPHLVSFCLALILSRSQFSSQALSLHGGGLRDTTRIAGASPDLWADIIYDNKDQVLDLIMEWSVNWNELANALRNSDKEKLIKLLHEASSWRNSFEK